MSPPPPDMQGHKANKKNRPQTWQNQKGQIAIVNSEQLGRYYQDLLDRISSLTYNAVKSHTQQQDSQMLDRWLEAPANTDFWTAEAPRGSSEATLPSQL